MSPLIVELGKFVAAFQGIPMELILLGLIISLHQHTKRVKLHCLKELRELREENAALKKRVEMLESEVLRVMKADAETKQWLNGGSIHFLDDDGGEHPLQDLGEVPF